MHQNFHIRRITDLDARRQTDVLRTFVDVMSANEPMYPDIDRWIRGKVIPGLREHSRTAFIGYLDNQPVATAVVKRDTNAKFCHLRLESSAQRLGLGELFFVLMACDVRAWARHVHFTLPESLWEERRDFFGSFGFSETTMASTQYRLFDQELECCIPFPTLWSHVLRKLPGLVGNMRINDLSLHPRLLLTVKPEFASRIMEGKKTVEIRARFSKKWVSQRISLYASGTVKALVGEATISRVTTGNPEDIWAMYRDGIGCSAEEYNSYIGEKDEIYAIELTDVTPYVDRVPLSQMRHLIDHDLAGPQSYIELSDETPWFRAVSVAALLQGGLVSLSSES